MTSAPRTGPVFLGVDIGTSSTKAVLVDARGEVVAKARREHEVSRPAPDTVEMDATIWWQEFVDLAGQLCAETGLTPAAIGVSGMGPSALLTDAADRPLAPSALYGVDARAVAEIEELNAELGAERIYEVGDSYLTTQSAGPKLRWFARHRPAEYAAASRFHMVASFLVARLTDEHVLDRQSASQATPLYDAATQEWDREWAAVVAPGIELPRLAWTGEIAGTVTARAAAAVPGLRAGTPVVAGSIDAWTEAQSVGAVRSGDLMLMYGTTMFLIATGDRRMRHPAMWGTTGLAAGQWNLAGGMATSGAITGWLRDLFGRPDYEELVAEAARSRPGSDGLLMLPYFAGERTPIQDPAARGTFVGLTLSHTRGDLYRSALEATALAVRHNIEVIREAGVRIERIVGGGGGTATALWPQIVSDVAGVPQELRRVSIGASYGDAFLAARAIGEADDIDSWNPVEAVVEPQAVPVYDELYRDYRELYEATASLQHRAAARQS